MKILAIDPGPEESAWVILLEDKIVSFGKFCNEQILEEMALGILSLEQSYDLVIEQVSSFGMPVGAEVFETVFWSGRFAQAWGREFHRLKRHEVKMHLCHNMRAKDGNIRQSLIDKFGGPAAIGRKKSPGPLFGISGDVWSALAVAVTFAETSRQ